MRKSNENTEATNCPEHKIPLNDDSIMLRGHESSSDLKGILVEKKLAESDLWLVWRFTFQLDNEPKDTTSSTMERSRENTVF